MAAGWSYSLTMWSARLSFHMRFQPWIRLLVILASPISVRPLGSVQLSSSALGSRLPGFASKGERSASIQTKHHDHRCE